MRLLATLSAALALGVAGVAQAHSLPAHTAQHAVWASERGFFNGSIPQAGSKFRVLHCTRQDPKGRTPRSALVVYCRSYAAEMFGQGCVWWDRVRLVGRRVEVGETIYGPLHCGRRYIP